MYGLGIMAADIDDLSHAYPVQQYSGSWLVSIPLKNRNQPLIWNRSDVENFRDTGVVAVNSNIQTGTFVDFTAAQVDLGQRLSLVRTNNRRTILHTYPTAGSSGTVYHYMADKEGELAYSFISEQGNRTMFRLDGENWVKCPVDLEQIQVIDNANDPGQLLVVGPWAGGKARPLQLMDAATGRLGDVALQDQNYDFNGWTYRNPANGDLLGAIFGKKADPASIGSTNNMPRSKKSWMGCFPAW